MKGVIRILFATARRVLGIEKLNYVESNNDNSLELVTQFTHLESSEGHPTIPSHYHWRDRLVAAVLGLVQGPQTTPGKASFEGFKSWIMYDEDESMRNS